VESEFERLRKKVENYPSASAYNRLAELARLNGNVADAERVCQRCIKEFPRNGQAYVILAEIALAGSRREEALRHLHAAVERDQRSFGGHRLLAEMASEAGEFSAALDHFRHLQTLKPGDGTIGARIEQLTAQSAAQSAARSAPATTNATTTVTMDAVRAPANPTTTATPAASPPTRSTVRTPLPRSGTATITRGAALASLAKEDGVRGVVVFDAHGRVVVSAGLPEGRAELVAALAAEITAGNQAVHSVLGQDQPNCWVVEAERGQIVAFKRDANLTLAAVAAAGVRIALLELRARQALLDLGVA